MPIPPRFFRPGSSRVHGQTLLVALAACLLIAPPAAAEPPAEGDCPSVGGGGAASGAVARDAAPRLLREGMIIRKQDLLALRKLLPQEIWRNREIFFYEGMRMEIGPCHRHYPLPAFYRHASKRFAGEPQLDEDGNLLDYTAGVPFPQHDIDADSQDAGTRWAWDFAKRYRGAGHEGDFRITNFPSRTGSIQVYLGHFFALQAAERSDLPGNAYAIPQAHEKLWAVGGRFSSPFGARGLAWRQFRSAASERRWQQPDDVFVYVPSMRKMRRSATPWVNGAFVPSYTISGASAGGGLPMAQGGSINPTAGRSIAVSQDARSGLIGLFLRPNAYVWRLRGERTVIAPLNANRPGYPIQRDRNYGYSGLSLASERWDVRRAVVIEGALRKRGENIRTLTLYIDYQTLQPLYWITRTGKNRLLDIGVLAHRFSNDLRGYPEWPGGTGASVFEPVAAAFFNALEGQGGWLRESWNLLSLPFSEAARKRMTSSDALERGH